MGILLSASGLSKAFGARRLFDGIAFSVSDGERIGLIGPNGAGKSTLLAVLAGEEPPDTGDLAPRRGLRMAHVAQDDRSEPGATVEGVLLEALRRDKPDEAERRAAADLFLARGSWPPVDQAVDALSGGWRRRLAIARAWIREPDLVLLDEPTNHLDIEGILWLEALLREPRPAAVVVTHDRRFLENVATRVVELNPAYPDGLFAVDGAYSAFLEERTLYLAARAHRHAALETNVRREVEWLRRNPQARTTKADHRVREAHRLVEELAESAQRQALDRAIDVDFAASGRQTKELLVASGVGAAVDGRRLFAGIDLTLSPGRRVGIVGPNGSGKSTLLRVLSGARAPDEGRVRQAPDLRVAWFDQERAPLDPDETLRHALSAGRDEVIYRGSRMHVAGWARRFLFGAAQLDQPLSSLSGGERARVRIAQLMLIPADVLLLDEPTNDLDIPSLEVLEESLVDFPGTVALVTHDRYLLDRACGAVLGLDGRGGAHIVADYAQWERWLASAAAEPAPQRTAPRAERPRPGLAAFERKELGRMEETILAAEEEVAAREARLSAPDVATDAARLQECWAEVQAARDRVAALYARWQELEEKRAASGR
ncbi:MAG: ABC-F family ATP-binding cassette domain-containing protein [Chthonomonadales bacterium]|nr:ABC-F family ATP-binding cassette domain-containing protein [Chthonomonadales bacterium]